MPCPAWMTYCTYQKANLIRGKPAPRPDISIARETESHRCPENREKPRQHPRDERMRLDPRRAPLLVRQDKVRVDGDDEDPVVRLDDKDLRQVAVEAAELGLLGRPDPAPADVHRRRHGKVECHDAVADGEAEEELVSKGLEVRKQLGIQFEVSLVLAGDWRGRADIDVRRSSRSSTRLQSPRVARRSRRPHSESG